MKKRSQLKGFKHRLERLLSHVQGTGETYLFINFSSMILYFAVFCFFIFTGILHAVDNTNIPPFKILETDQLYPLSGTWKLTHTMNENFKEVDYDDSKWDSVIVPSIWMNQGRVETMGWYRTHVFISDSFRDTDLGFISSNILEAGEIYFNGVLIGKLGLIDKNGKLIKSNPRLDYFSIDKSIVRYNADNVLSIKLANYYGGMGGLQHLPYIGSLELCKRKFNSHLIFYSSFAFGMIGLGFYHLVIFFKFRNDRIYLYYSGIVFSIALFVVSVFKLNYWFVESFYLQFVLFTSSMIFGALSLYLFVNSFFGYKLTKLSKNVIALYFCFVLFEILPIFIPSLFVIRNKYLIKIHSFINVIFILTAGVILIKSSLLRKSGWKIILIGAIISFPLFLWDSIRAFDLVPQKNWFIIENCLVITITFAVAISKKYSMEYEALLEVEKAYALDLKQEVEDKTNLLLNTNLELQRANQLKNKLFHTISQSLKNPLEMLDTVITLFANKEYSRADLKKYFSQLNENIKRNRFLLENLLNWSYSQLEERGNVQLISLDLVPILKETILFFQSEAKAKSVEILFYLDSSTYVFGNHNMLRLIFINLISNAIKFTPRNSTVLVEVKRKKSLISIEISDSGHGISSDLLESIFSNNDLVSRNGTENEKGTGLGLKITKDFIDKLGGKFLVETELSFGTKVKVKLRADDNGNSKNINIRRS